MVKRWHDRRIQKQEFKVGEQVLLYNSHLRFFAGKLLSKWEGPYIIEEVYRSGAIKINNSKGTNPRVVNGQRIKHYISGMPINVETNIMQTMTPEEHIKEFYRSGAIKINNAEGTNPKVVNGQRIKHYISGTPINVEKQCYPNHDTGGTHKINLPKHSRILKNRWYVIR